MHRTASDPGRDGVPLRAWHTTGAPQQGGVGGRSSSCLGGSLLIQPTVEVHGNCHGRNLGVERCKSAPLNLTFPPLSQHGFGSQPNTPSALERRDGCTQGRKLTSLELQVVLRAAAAPRAPQGWSQPHLQAQGGGSTAVLRHSPPRQQCRLPPHPPPLRWS